MEFKKEDLSSYMIIGTRIFRVNCTLAGWGLSGSTRYLRTDLYNWKISKVSGSTLV
jgi:hypothetical protein